MKLKDWIADRLGISQIKGGSTYRVGNPQILQGFGGDNIYLSDFVNNCIDRTAAETP